MTKTIQATTKVVINERFGGFGLSDEAKREYLRRCGLTWTEEKDERFPSLIGPHFYVDGELWTERDLSRTDPVLVSVVEDMGTAANDKYAGLEVVELPKGTAYIIDEYDGYETIQRRDEVDWRFA